MKITIDISNVLESYELKPTESFCLYVKKPDGYNAYGYIGSYTGAETLAMLVSDYINDPDVYGVWVTIESGDGLTDCTVFLNERRMPL